MADYTTQAELVKAVGGEDILAQLADDDNNPADISDPVTVANIAQAITAASKKIDLILSGTLDMTDSDVLAAVKYPATYIALYLLYARRHSDETNRYTRYYVDTVRDLRELAKGKYHASNAPEPSLTITTNVSSRDRVFGRATDTDDVLERL